MCDPLSIVVLEMTSFPITGRMGTLVSRVSQTRPVSSQPGRMPFMNECQLRCGWGGHDQLPSFPQTGTHSRTGVGFPGEQVPPGTEGPWQKICCVGSEFILPSMSVFSVSGGVCLLLLCNHNIVVSLSPIDRGDTVAVDFKMMSELLFWQRPWRV